jgi:cell division protein FtsW (lipid II flippase)
MLGFIISLFLAVLIRWSKYIIHLLICLTVGIIICYYSGLLDHLNRWVSSEITYGEQRMRIQLNKEGIEKLFDSDLHHILFGRGIGNGIRLTSNYNRWPAHNAFILAADEVGIIGLIVYVSMFAYLTIRIIFINMFSKDDEDIAISRGLLSGFVALLVVLQFHAGFIEQIMWLFFGIVESMYRICYGNEKQKIDNTTKMVKVVNN